MGGGQDSWRVKTLEEILQEKKRRRKQEEKVEMECLKCSDDRDSKQDSAEQGEQRDPRTEITIRNSPYTRKDSMEDRGEAEESLAIHPSQQMSRPAKAYLCKKRKEKHRHRSHSAEGGKHARVKGESKHGPRKRHREEQDQDHREWQTQKRRKWVRERPRREGDRLEQVKGKRGWERRRSKHQKETRDQKGQGWRQEPEARREGLAHHWRTREAYSDKGRATPCSRSPVWPPRESFALGARPKPVKGEKTEARDLLSNRQDSVSDRESKSSSARSSVESGSGSEDPRSHWEEASEQSADLGNEQEMSEGEEPGHEDHIMAVPESRSEGDSGDSEEEEEVGEGTPQSSMSTAGDHPPDSPALSPTEPKQELPKYLPALQGCRSVEEFQCLNRIEEGTYGVVYRAREKKTDAIVALKRLKVEGREGFPITSLREIHTLLKAQHPNIVTIREIVVGSHMDQIYIVMNYVEHDLKSLMQTMQQPFLPGEVKTLMLQLLQGVNHLHDNWILHRDLKTSNLLLSHEGILKIADFGLAREYGMPLKAYTPVVVTLWYRAPELLLGAKEYSTPVDMWSVGSIFAELLTHKPLFPGKLEMDQIHKIFKDLGTPSEKIWPGYNELPVVKKMTFSQQPYNHLRKRFGTLLSDQDFDLMNRFLTYFPGRRMTAEDGLKHEYFRENPLPVHPSMFPTWPAKSEQQQQQRVKCGTSPQPPSGGLGFNQLGEKEEVMETGFHLTTTNQGASAVGPGFSLKF
ncbi:LOW QUALITY PROTEIN: cyclin-dependent kinase 11B-like [Dipodomys spectabilis]|uniref:LOW QUALITY PROTEIN: cyclin-dependent kinase 11B-like n=1 Tax=Dipodomys spectabilis TaxID=105255 RepID=UPI001C5359F4|nr:LOW QUALITY PROTEIN: cyclin-dependent kinase 11B-like [Dipodomys spectabilis]